MHRKKIPLKNRLLTRLLVSHVLLVSIPLVITGLVLVNTARISIEKTVLARNLEFARRTSEQIQLTLKRAQEILRLNAQNPTIYGMNRVAQDMVINSIIREFKIFRRISVIDSQGKMASSTSYPLTERDLSSEDFFKTAIAGNSYISEVNILVEEKLPVVTMAEPIMRFKVAVGVLVGEVRLKAMWDLMDASVIGENGQALIFDRGGRFIAHSDRRKVYLQESFEEEAIIADIAQGLSGQRIYTDSEGKKMIAAYAPLVERGWGILIQQPTREAFAPARKMTTQVLLFVLLSILVASALAFFYTRRIVKPVNHLVSSIDRFASGDLSYRIPQLGKDEIGVLSEEFNRMADRLQQFQEKLKRTERFEILSKLASVLSHEIRNPLNSMAINLQIMKREIRKSQPDRQKIRSYIDIVTSEIDRVEELVSNFLLIAKPPKLEKQKLAVNKILDEIIIANEADSLRRGIEVKKAYEVDSLVAPIDKAKMKQVFLNIYLNAVQAMTAGGELKIELKRIKGGPGQEVDRKHTYALIKFSDTGVGIEPSKLPRIFDFYYSTKESGTGLGLSIAQQIVEEHGGKITVHSQVGKGTAVSIYLPADEWRNF